MNRNPDQIQIKTQNHIDVNQFIAANLSFTKIIADIENYRNAVLNKIDFLKKGNILQLTVASIVYIDDQSSMYTISGAIRLEFENFFKTARAGNAPLLIKTNDEWLIYGSDQKGLWQLTKIIDEKIIQQLKKHKLPFEKNIVISLFETSSHASLLKEVVKNSHVYCSKYIEIKNKYKYHEYLILIERLSALKKRIQDFERFEKNWLHGKSIVGRSQDEIIKNTIKSIEDEAGFAKSNMEETIDDLYALSFDVIESNNKILFDNLNHCLNRVKNEADRISATMKTWDAAISSSPIFELAKLVGARFIPVSQNMNPWSTEESANDWNGIGHQKVLRWRDDILRTGKYLLQSVNANVSIKKDENLGRTNENYLTGLICQSLPAIRTALSQLLSQLDHHKLYRLTVHNDHARCSGIALGLRGFSNGEIEFFDPHHGLFIFPEHESFRIWFSQYLKQNLLNKPAISLNLFELGKQPSFSVPTVPIIATFNATNTSFDNKQIKEKIILKINEEITNLKASWMPQSGKIIKALEILKKRINEANTHMTLAGIVQAWLSETDGLSSRPYREIIKGVPTLGESTTSRLINIIVSNYEINQERMMCLQGNMIKNIASFMATKTFPVSLLFEKIKKICSNENTTPNEIISAIKSKVNKLKYTGRLFTADNNTDQETKNFCNLIKNLDQNNPYSLIKITLLLEELTDEISIKNEKSHIKNNIEISSKTKTVLL